MKKFYLFFIIIGLFIFPLITHAEELPREGVTYFMTYPSKEEYAHRDYDQAINPQERLIYSDITDANGEVQLVDWDDVGEIRIVQKVPKGYSTNKSEITTDLSSKTANFVDYRGIRNPKTGKSLIIIVILGLLVMLTVYASHKKKTQALLIIPIVALSFYKVKADNYFTITVVDKEGKALSGVEIEVYAKPKKVEAAPAMKFNANGGHFLDESTEFYIRLPHNNCTVEELTAFYTEEENINLQLNTSLVHRDGYIVKNVEPSADENNTEELLYSNETEFKYEWEPDEEVEGVTINGNGGLITMNGKQLKTIEISNKLISGFRNVPNLFQNKGNYLIGYDNNSSCSNYDERGLQKGNKLSLKNKVYACWNQKPDGIYVNDKVFVGTDESCFIESHVLTGSNYITFNNNNLDSMHITYNELHDNISITMHKLNSILMTENIDSIEKIEIIKNGESLLIINAEELSWTPTTGNDPINGNQSSSLLEDINRQQSVSYIPEIIMNKIYTITNQSKKEMFMNYINRVLEDRCNIK